MPMVVGLSESVAAVLKILHLLITGLAPVEASRHFKHPPLLDFDYVIFPFPFFGGNGTVSTMLALISFLQRPDPFTFNSVPGCHLHQQLWTEPVASILKRCTIVFGLDSSY